MQNVITDEKLIDEILTRGVGEFIDPENIFRKKLIAKAKGQYDKDIIIKYGVDPTRPDIHLGHAVCFRKLRQLQDLGCKIVFLIGDFTAQIGDPTGKSKTRPELHLKEIQENMNSYLEQVDKILLIDKDHFSWIINSDWYTDINDIFVPPPAENDAKHKADIWQKTRMQLTIRKDKTISTVSFASFLVTLRHITHARLVERDMFQDRFKKGDQLFMHELVYPILQGLDSLLINKIFDSCDVEVGGSDQTFNMLMGRDAQKFSKNELLKLGKSTDQQSVLSLNLLIGTDGKEKMSKSLDNYIGITEEPNQIFGKVMSIPDSLIHNYLELCTDIPMEEIKKMDEDIKSEKMNPRNAKLRLAEEIVKIYHSKEAAAKARDYFIKTFSQKEIPENISEIKAQENMKLLDFLVSVNVATSNSDARRKIEQGGVEIDGKKIEDWKAILDKSYDGKVMKVGKKDFVKIKFE